MPDTLRFLVVDDDQDVTEWLAAALGIRGIEVTQARSGTEALEILAEEGPFDVIVTDFNMPDMTGLQLVHMVRTTGAKAPVIMLTACPQTVDDKLDIVNRAELLAKPCTVSRLIDTAVELLAPRV